MMMVMLERKGVGKGRERLRDGGALEHWSTGAEWSKQERLAERVQAAQGLHRHGHGVWVCAGEQVYY